MKTYIQLVLVIGLFAAACATVPITGRKQGKLLPESELTAMSVTEYNNFLRQNKLSTNQQQTEMVRRVGNSIKQATERYYAKIGKSQQLTGYKWEFNLVESPEINAWCMPGGKVVIYTGILPVTQDEDGLAIVMGHEIAHALAHHGNERMTQGLLAQAGGMALSVALSQKPQQTQELFLQAYGVGAQVGALLPFSRLQESEADKIGLYIASLAGYNPDAAPGFWNRMIAAAKGNRPPEFLSTHPDPSRRAENLKNWSAEARAFAAKYK